jgi:hypothetical protein
LFICYIPIVQDGVNKVFIENLNSLDFPWLKYGDDIEIGDIGNFIKHQV